MKFQLQLTSGDWKHTTDNQLCQRSQLQLIHLLF